MSSGETKRWEKAELHPFWFINRASPEEKQQKTPDDSKPEPNMEAIHEEMCGATVSCCNTLEKAKVE